jgi:hypothetical protein
MSDLPIPRRSFVAPAWFNTADDVDQCLDVTRHLT